MPNNKREKKKERDLLLSSFSNYDNLFPSCHRQEKREGGEKKGERKSKVGKQNRNHSQICDLAVLQKRRGKERGKRKTSLHFANEHPDF